MILQYDGGNINPDFLAFFYASWSSNCNLHLDALKKLENTYKDLLILKINVTKFYNLKTNYKINRIPTFIIFKNSEIKARLDGYINQYSLLEWVKKNRS